VQKLRGKKGCEVYYTIKEMNAGPGDIKAKLCVIGPLSCGPTTKSEEL
jgi:hypothetical protein